MPQIIIPALHPFAVMQPEPGAGVQVPICVERSLKDRIRVIAVAASERQATTLRRLILDALRTGVCFAGDVSVIAPFDRQDAQIKIRLNIETIAIARRFAHQLNLSMTQLWHVLAWATIDRKLGSTS
jgi:hypothetical protein